MRIEITGRKVDVGASLRAHIEESVLEVAEKYASRATDATVILSKDGHNFVCDCSAHLSSGLTAQATAKETEPYAACDAAVARFAKQLRRHKRRLKDHHQRNKEPIASIDAAAYVLSLEDESTVDEDTSDMAQPVIVAEKTEKIPTLSVGDAVMQMELRSARFQFFVHDVSGRVNAVYCREDGNIGWVDPERTE